MRRELKGLLLVLSLTLLSGEAFADPPADEPSVGEWVLARVKKAKKGEREIVRVPLVTRAMNWGCDCPLNYIGTSPMDSGDGSFVNPSYFEREPYDDMEGQVVVAEGYFTGTSTEEKGEPGEVYTVYDFEVLRARAYRGHETADAELRVVLSGAEAKKEVSPLDDGKPWMVVVASLPLLEKGAEKKASELKDKLVAAGFPSAEIFDSRRAARLFCCYQTVVAGRYAAEADAKAALKLVKKKFKSAYTRLGW
jgi:hypothetical protein